MMRQAGRYQKAYRDLALQYPSFRQRSENTDLIVEISLQPWDSFRPDGVIIFRCDAGACSGVRMHVQGLRAGGARTLTMTTSPPS